MKKLLSFDWRLFLVSALLAGIIGIVVYFAPSTEFSGVLAFVATLLSIIVTSYVERWKQKSSYILDEFRNNLDIIEKYSLGMWEGIATQLYNYRRQDQVEKLSYLMKEELIKKKNSLQREEAHKFAEEFGDPNPSDEVIKEIVNKLFEIEMAQDQIRSLKKAQGRVEIFLDVTLPNLAITAPKFTAALDVINDKKLSQLYKEFVSLDASDQNLIEKIDSINRRIFKRIAELRSGTHH